MSAERPGGVERRSAAYPTDVRESCPPAPTMGRRPALLLLLLGAAGAYDPQHCPLAVEFSCQDGQPAYSVCRDNPCDGIHTEAENVEHACATDEHGCPLRARSWADDLKSCDDVCARAGASCARAARMSDDPCASEAHEESELSCDQDLHDAKSVCCVGTGVALDVGAGVGAGGGRQRYPCLPGQQPPPSLPRTSVYPSAHHVLNSSPQQSPSWCPHQCSRHLSGSWAVRSCDPS